MLKVKDDLVKEWGEGWELKRKHDDTISEFERLQKAYQYLELEKEALELSTTIMEGEKRDFEGKISELEAQKSAACKQTWELRTRVEELEEQNRILENQLKAASERQCDITPFRNHAFLIQRNMHQVQLKRTDKIYKIKQEETRLKEISSLSIDFRQGLLKYAEKDQGQLTWVESNSAFPAHLPSKTPEGLKIEIALLYFYNKYALRLTTAVEENLIICKEFYNKMHIVHNKL